MLSIISALVMTASLPPLDLGWAAWIGLAPFLWALRELDARNRIILGFSWGLVHYVSMLYWVVWVLGYYGGMGPVVSIGPMLLLCGYLALYPCIFSLLAGPLLDKPFSSMGTAALWVALEYARANLLTGFPWCLLGYSQAALLPVAQISDITGVYGISFLLVALNAVLASFFPWRSTLLRAKLAQEALPVSLIISLVLYYGGMRLSQAKGETSSSSSVNTALIQGNIDQSMKWERSMQRLTIERYLALSAKAARPDMDLLVMPETAMPFFLQDDSELSREFISGLKKIGIPAIVGSPAYRKSGSTTSYFNRAYVVEPERGIAGQYDKVHLVPFGEYVPLKGLLSFINRLVPAAGDFEEGPGALPVNAGGLKVGIIICFEAIFPDVSRDHIRAGGQILVNITNDAWFGKTSAPYQHMAMSRLRAIENRVPLLRAANTGISGIISDTGEIIASGGLFSEEVVAGSAPYGRFSQTFYTRFGDLFAILSCAAALSWLLFSRYPRGGGRS
jgi:apolipoprotein N-acyltransferase